MLDDLARHLARRRRGATTRPIATRARTVTRRRTRSSARSSADQVGWLDGAISRFGRGYTGEPDQIAEELARDAAVLAADTLLLTVPSQLGVDYNAAMLETMARNIAPAIGWTPKGLPQPVG